MENHKENLESAKEWYKIAKEQNNQLAIEILEKHFPELKESEDERIRKAVLKAIMTDEGRGVMKDGGFKVEDILSWLEKKKEPQVKVIIPKFRVGDIIRERQKAYPSEPDAKITSIVEYYYRFENVDGSGGGSIGFAFEDEYELVEQKPSWSKEDEHCIELLLPIIDSSSLIPKNRKKCKEFLKSLKERVQPHPKQEWSEEDEHRIEDAIYFLETARKHYASDEEINKTIDWLKSLKERLVPNC